MHAKRIVHTAQVRWLPAGYSEPVVCRRVSGSSRFPRSKAVHVEESRAVVDGEDVDTIVADAVNDSIASP